MFIFDKIRNKTILKVNKSFSKNVEMFFGTRDFPIKHGNLNNLIENTADNRKLLCSHLNIDDNSLIIPNQSHSLNVMVATKGFEYKNCDALITNEKNIALALNFADCVPLIFYDFKNHVIAVTHAGWRGTCGKIAIKTCEKMQNVFNTCYNDLFVFIGPSISLCCYIVSNDVKEKLISTIEPLQYNFVSQNNYVDLKQINKFQLENIGISNVFVSTYCTKCNNDLFFSHRKENGYTARHFALAILK